MLDCKCNWTRSQDWRGSQQRVHLTLFGLLADGSGTEPPATPTSPQPDSGNGATNQPKRIIGVGFGDIFRDGPVKLRTQSNPIIEERKVKDQEKDKVGLAQVRLVSHEETLDQSGQNHLWFSLT